MGIRHKKAFGIYHWDTFDNETRFLDERDTLEEAVAYVQEKYAGRLDADHGADQVDIVNQKGDIVRAFKTC